MCGTAWSWSDVSIRSRPPQLQAVPRCIRSTALLAVVGAFSGVVRSFTTASSGTRSLVLEELTVNFSEIARSQEWYSPAEVTELMRVTRHPVQERWCSQGKIACEKDRGTEKWRIPGHETERLWRGGRREGI